MLLSEICISILVYTEVYFCLVPALWLCGLIQILSTRIVGCRADSISGERGIFTQCMGSELTHYHEEF